jgi:hypothetical protein
MQLNRIQNYHSCNDQIYIAPDTLPKSIRCDQIFGKKLLFSFSFMKKKQFYYFNFELATKKDHAVAEYVPL